MNETRLNTVNRKQKIPRLGSRHRWRAWVGPLFAGGLTVKLVLRAVHTRRNIGRLEAPLAIGLPDPPPSVTVILSVGEALIVSDGEASVFQHCLNSLLGQDYPNYTILVLNPGSPSKIRGVLLSAELSDTKKRLRHLSLEQSPPGWSSRSFAYQYGTECSSSDWLLFTTPDTIHAPETLRTIVSYAERRSIDALSFIPHFEAPLIPDTGQSARMFTRVWRMGSRSIYIHLLPHEAFLFTDTHRLGQVRDPHSPLALALDEYFLVHRTAYERCGEYLAMPASEAVTDLATAVKYSNGTLDLLDGRALVQVIPSALDGKSWTKRSTMFTSADKQPALLFARGLRLLTEGFAPLLPPLLCGEHRRLGIFLAFCSYGAQVAVRLPVDLFTGAAPWYSLLAPLGWIAMAALAFSTAWRRR